MYLLDTNICIYLIKRHPPKLIQKLTALSPTDIALSAVTVAELEYGVAKSRHRRKNKEALARFLAPFQIAPFDGPAAVCYGEVRASLEWKGKVIGSMDMLIAAHALALNVTLVTNNLREFKRVAGLALENWV